MEDNDWIVLCFGVCSHEAVIPNFEISRVVKFQSGSICSCTCNLTPIQGFAPDSVDPRFHSVHTSHIACQPVDKMSEEEFVTRRKSIDFWLANPKLMPPVFPMSDGIVMSPGKDTDFEGSDDKLRTHIDSSHQLSPQTVNCDRNFDVAALQRHNHSASHCKRSQDAAVEKEEEESDHDFPCPNDDDNTATKSHSPIKDACSFLMSAVNELPVACDN